jgi:hypothetical protein
LQHGRCLSNGRQVGAALETVRQLEAQMTMRSYAAFLKESRDRHVPPIAA